MTRIRFESKDHDIQFEFTLSGNIEDLPDDEIVSQFNDAFENGLHNQCEYMVDFSIGEDQNKIHDLIEHSKTIAKEVLSEKIPKSEMNKTYSDRLEQHIMYEYQEGRDETASIAYGFIHNNTYIIDGDELISLEDRLGDDLITSITDQVIFVIEEDIERNVTLRDLIGMNTVETEFLYLPEYQNEGRGIIDNYYQTYSTNYSSVSSLNVDDTTTRLFELINVDPKKFSDYLLSKGYDQEVVEKYRDISNVWHSDDRGPAIEYQAVINLIDESQPNTYPVVFGKVNLCELLDRDITKPFIVKSPLYGLHEFSNGSGYFEQGSDFVIEPDDFNFTGGKVYRYSVDDVYGFSESYMKVKIGQPLLASTFHTNIDESGLIGKLTESGAISGIRASVKNHTFAGHWNKPGMDDPVNGYIMRGEGSHFHLRSLPTDEAVVLCDINKAYLKLKSCESSKDSEWQFGVMKSIGDIFSVQCQRLAALGLIEKFESGEKILYQPTYLGNTFVEHEENRIKEMIAERDNGDQFSLSI